MSHLIYYFRTIIVIAIINIINIIFKLINTFIIIKVMIFIRNIKISRILPKNDFNFGFNFIIRTINFTIVNLINYFTLIIGINSLINFNFIKLIKFIVIIITVCNTFVVIIAIIVRVITKFVVNFRMFKIIVIIIGLIRH
jgi:hypothetical protein